MRARLLALAVALAACGSQNAGPPPPDPLPSARPPAPPDASPRKCLRFAEELQANRPDTTPCLVAAIHDDPDAVARAVAYIRVDSREFTTLASLDVDAASWYSVALRVAATDREPTKATALFEKASMAGDAGDIRIAADLQLLALLHLSGEQGRATEVANRLATLSGARSDVVVSVIDGLRAAQELDAVATVCEANLGPATVWPCIERDPDRLRVGAKKAQQRCLLEAAAFSCLGAVQAREGCAVPATVAEYARTLSAAEANAFTSELISIKAMEYVSFRMDEPGSQEVLFHLHAMLAQILVERPVVASDDIWLPAYHVLRARDFRPADAALPLRDLLAPSVTAAICGNTACGHCRAGDHACLTACEASTRVAQTALDCPTRPATP